MSNKFCISIKLSRWGAKNVTSLLPQPSGLAAGLKFKTVTVAGVVMLKQDLKVPAKGTDLSW